MEIDLSPCMWGKIRALEAAALARMHAKAET
jgi:hypothetical protein